MRPELGPTSNETFNAEEATIAALEAWAVAMLGAMEGSPVADYLDSCEGIFSDMYADELTREHLGGSHRARVNDLAESIFGTVDNYYHTFGGQHVATAAGVAQSIQNHDYDIEPTTTPSRQVRSPRTARRRARRRSSWCFMIPGRRRR